MSEWSHVQIITLGTVFIYAFLFISAAFFFVFFLYTPSNYVGLFQCPEKLLSELSLSLVWELPLIVGLTEPTAHAVD